MHKQLFNTTIHGLIVLPVFILTLSISTPSISNQNEEDVSEMIYNYQVHYACDNWLNPKKDKDKTSIELAEFICGIYLGMVQEQNQYHQSFIKYFTKYNDEEMVDFAHVYDLTGCNIEELSHRDFAELYLNYMANNEESMDYSFYTVVPRTLEPYCEQVFDRSIKFYLGEESGGRIS